MRTAYFAIPLALLTGCVIHTRAAGTATAGPAAAEPAPAPAPAPAPVPAAPPPAAAGVATATPSPAPAAPPAAPGVAPPLVISGSVIVAFDPLPPNQPPVTEPPAPPVAVPVPAAPGVANGQPPNLKPGAAPAYWVWRDASGVWHLRTTTAKKLHRFHGKITATTGQIVDVKPVRIEFKDRLVVSPKAVVFSFDTAGHMDGFDFRISDNQCASFNLHPNAGKKILVGASESQPLSQHFTLCP